MRPTAKAAASEKPATVTIIISVMKHFSASLRIGLFGKKSLATVYPDDVYLIFCPWLLKSDIAPGSSTKVKNSI